MSSQMPNTENCWRSNGAGHPWLMVLLLLLFALFLYYVLFVNRARVEVALEVEQPTWFKVFWAGEGEGFSERRVRKVRVKPGRSSYVFYLTDLESAAQLRIDTHEYQGSVLVRELSLYQRGAEEVVIVPEPTADKLKALANIASISPVQEGVRVISTGVDPQLLFRLELLDADYEILPDVVRICFFAVLLFLVYLYTAPLVHNFAFVPMCLFGVLLLVVTMALISKENKHPDEFVHVAAVEYYKNHLLPPDVYDTSIRNSYSPYGVSRLHGNEVYYLLAGKFAALVEPLFLNHYLSCRAFNVFLLIATLLYVIGSCDARLIALPLLMSPQIWYLYSYCNSDAFAVTILFFMSCQLVVSGSMLDRYLSGDQGGRQLLLLAVCGVLAGVMLLLKHNYLPYIFFACVVLWCKSLAFNYRPDKIRFWKRSVAIALVALSVLASKHVADLYVSGPDKKQAVAQVATEHAHMQYRLTTPAQERAATLYFRERGVSLEDVVSRYRWFEKTVQSSFGIYGYFQTSSTTTYFHVISYSALAVLLYLVGTIAIKGGTTDRILLASGIGLVLMLVGVSLYHSWTADYQPQGRYLFAGVGMLCVVFGWSRQVLSRRWLSVLAVWMFFLSSYSFITAGLMNIARGSYI